MKKCDICGVGNVVEVIDENEYWDTHFHCHILKMKGYECDVCLSFYANADQVNFNAKQARDIENLNQEMLDKMDEMYE
jgi:hypothetical protein